jgi:hypothetical protein
VALAACVIAARASRRKERTSFIFNNNKRLLARAKENGEGDSYALVIHVAATNLTVSTAGEGGGGMRLSQLLLAGPSHHPESGWTAWNSLYLTAKSSGYVAHLPRLVGPLGPLPAQRGLLGTEYIPRYRTWYASINRGPRAVSSMPQRSGKLLPGSYIISIGQWQPGQPSSPL